MESSHVMIIVIVAIVMVASVLKARYRAMNGIIEDENGNELIASRTDDAAQQAEIKALKDRIAVLERIATDGRESRMIAHEIEKLRDR